VTTKQIPAAKDHKFFMVHVSDSPGPNKRYDSLADAANAATNLCEWKHSPVFVLECVGVVVPKKVSNTSKRRLAVFEDNVNAAIHPEFNSELRVTCPESLGGIGVKTSCGYTAHGRHSDSVFRLGSRVTPARVSFSESGL